MTAFDPTGDAPKISVAQFNEICRERLPFASFMGLELVEIRPDGARMRAHYDPSILRSGGTVAGPILMGLADVALYAAVLGRIGPVELVVSTQLSINFLRKPGPRDVIAEASLLKLGRRLAVGEVSLFSDGDPDTTPVAHVTATYSIPPAG